MGSIWRFDREGHQIENDIFRNPPTPPNCAPGTGRVNSRTLTPLGAFALKEMMRHAMLIDIDHMSERAYLQAMQIAEPIPGKYR
jgi:hypothetical protein